MTYQQIQSVTEQQDNSPGIIGSMLEYLAVICLLVGCGLAAHAIYDYAQHPGHEYMFEKIAHHVAEDYEYEEDIYDCSEFSKELFNRLRYAGYNEVEIWSGCQNMNVTNNSAVYSDCHAWVELVLGDERIYIESTSGDIMSKSFYLKRFPYRHRRLYSTKIDNSGWLIDDND